ncbi:MAG: hypothetical protein KJ795_06085 [Gammaproteobacteria bacterium]|nr:hypothetical protein [Gammaproteobacteria bacterium]MBU1775179.1 hypothetical protein [Gammaproteobacteria bacterium]MBU1969551.1 hypothetical protein [Gammaproteobacteria bacterium]
MDYFKRILNWFRAIGRWFADSYALWLTIGICALALYISFRPGTSEPTIRWCGMFMDMLGLLTVAWGIADTRRQFGHPSLFKVGMALLRRFPTFNRSVTLAGSASSQANASSSARGYQIYGAGDNPTVESRLAAIEKNISAMNGRIDETQKEMDAEFRNVKTSLSQETQVRTLEDQATRKQLETTATGGVRISLMGLVWLFFGLVLSNASQEIAMWLQ